MDDDEVERRPHRGGMRWGLLTLLFLGIALTCVLVSNSQGQYSVVTFLGLLVGFGGAAYCSYRGLKGFSWLPR
jgi:nitrate/nitrite transporter NarK